MEANKPGFDSNAWWARSGLMDMVKPRTLTRRPRDSVPGMGDHPSSLALFSAIVTRALSARTDQQSTRVGSSLVANGV